MCAAGPVTAPVTAQVAEPALRPITGFRENPAWTPAELGDDLALWLDADDASTITLNGSKVSQWDDKSGEGRHATQSTESQQPVLTTSGLNGKNVVTFTGGNRGFSLNSGVGVPRDLVSVSSGYGYLYSSATDRLLWRSAPDQDLFWNSPGVNGFTSPNRASDTAVFIENYGATSNTYRVFIDGTSTASGSVDPWNNDNLFTRIGLQFNGSTGVPSWTGFMAEIVWTNALLSADDRQKLEGYLAWKWGLEANLPTGHPYKSARPTT